MATALSMPGFKARKRRKIIQRRLRVAVALMLLANLAVWAGVFAAFRGIDVAGLLPPLQFPLS
ncbi:MAG: hypothetical protein QM608_20500 [Caulobacter sp.]